MKRFLMGLFTIVVMAIVVACSGLDELPVEVEEPKEELGYLQLSNFVVSGDIENKDSDDEIETGSGTESKSGYGTRTDEDENNTTTHDFSNYYIEIIHSVNGIVWSGTYGQNLDTTTGKLKSIGLEPGTYTVWAYQDSYKGPSEGVAQDAPYYAGSANVEIVSKQTTQVTVTCRLYNIRVTVELSADLKDMFKVYDASSEDRLMTKVDIGVGDVYDEYNTYTFEKDATHSSPYMYYEDVAGGPTNIMKILLTGVFYSGPVEDIYTEDAFLEANAAKWKKVRMEKSIVGTMDAPLTGGQWRQISIDIEHNDEGNAQFVFTIENYVYDKEITVSTMTLYQNMSFVQEEAIPEDEINDERAPQVSIEGSTTDENGRLLYSITADMKNAVNEWTTYLIADITIPDGSSATVKNLFAEFKSSTNADLMAALTDAGFNDGIVPLFPVNSVSSYVTVASDGTMVGLPKEGMDAIYEYAGTHTIRLHTEGSDGRVGFADVVLTVSQSASVGPKVEWKVDGNSTDELEMSYGDTHTVIAEIKSSTGLTGLDVRIDSNTIPAEDLEDLGLAAEMDILNPATEAMTEKLTAFGFLPLNDPEKKNIQFSITDFMGTLAGLGAGTHKFTIIAADESGSTTKALTIIVDENN